MAARNQSWYERFFFGSSRSYVVNDGKGHKIPYQVDENGYLTDRIAITVLEVPFLPETAPFSIAKFVKGLFGIGKAAKTGVNLTKSQLKSISSLEKQIATHTDKLKAYKADPWKFDNMGHLKNAPNDAVRQKII